MTKKTDDIKRIIACQRWDDQLFMSSVAVNYDDGGEIVPLDVRMVESTSLASTEVPVSGDCLIAEFDDKAQYEDFPKTSPVFEHFKMTERLPGDAKVLVVLFGQSVSVGMYANDELTLQTELQNDAQIAESIQSECTKVDFIPTFVIVAGIMADKNDTYQQIKSRFPDALLLRDYLPECSLTAGLVVMAHDLHKREAELKIRKDSFINKMCGVGLSMCIQLSFDRAMVNVLSQTVKSVGDRYVKGKVTNAEGLYPTSVLIKEFKVQLDRFVEEKFETYREWLVIEMSKAIIHWLDLQDQDFSDIDPNWGASIGSIKAQLEDVKIEDFKNPWGAACIQAVTTQAYGMCGMPGNVNKSRDDADVRAVIAHVINKKSETVSYTLSPETKSDIIGRLVSTVDEGLTGLIETHVSKSSISQLINK